jgi:putative ABC transport system permease protein
MLALALKNLIRRPLRSLLTVGGLAVASGLLATLLSFGQGYERGLRRELDGMGMQLMLVPLGCPYDAAVRVLKGRALDVTLPESVLQTARRDPAVAVAAPVYAAALPRPAQGRTDLWVGVDESSRALRPWWRLTAGSAWPSGPDDVLLGAEAATTEMRLPGDRLYSPETGRRFVVCGVLERSGTSDDSQFFVPLATAQSMFRQPGRLTAVAVRLKDPALLRGASDRLQQAPGAQVVTLTEMMGTFLNLTGAARSLTLASAAVALCVSALGVFNTMLASVLERTRDLGVLRAVGFGRGAVFGLMACESVTLAITGGVAGLLLALFVGGGVQSLVHPYLPLAPEGGLPPLTPDAAARCLLVSLVVGLLAGAYPAWRASLLQPAAALDNGE